MCHLLLSDVPFVSWQTDISKCESTHTGVEQRILPIGDKSLDETAYLLSKITLQGYHCFIIF